MIEPLDERYLVWLYARIGNVKETRPSKSYWSLMRQLFTKEFVWIIPNDDNRVEDGRDLRYRFLEEEKVEGVDGNWMGLGCSFLELLLGLAQRLEFEADGTAKMWFWILLSNAGLDVFTDAHQNPEQIDKKMDEIIWRTYKPDGSGGLFPLKDSYDDQRDVELWYQLSAYLLED